MAGPQPAWQCKQEGQRLWQPGARSLAGCGGISSFLLSPTARGAPATGRGGGLLRGPRAREETPRWDQRPSATGVLSLNAGCRKGRGDSSCPLRSGPDAGPWEPGLAAASTPSATRWFPTDPAAPAPPPRRCCTRPHRSSEVMQGVGSRRGAKLPPFCPPPWVCCQLPSSCPEGRLVLTGGQELGEASSPGSPRVEQDRDFGVMGGPQDGVGGRSDQRFLVAVPSTTPSPQPPRTGLA